MPVGEIEIDNEGRRPFHVKRSLLVEEKGEAYDRRNEKFLRCCDRGRWTCRL